MSAVCVRIDLDLLRQRLSRGRRSEFSDQQLHRWLNERGFRLAGEWGCDGEEALGVFEDGEIIEKTTTSTIDGVTFSNTVRYR